VGKGRGKKGWSIMEGEGYGVIFEYVWGERATFHLNQIDRKKKLAIGSTSGKRGERRKHGVDSTPRRK